MRKPGNQGGFSLLELTASLAITLLLLASLGPVLAQNWQERKNESAWGELALTLERAQVEATRWGARTHLGFFQKDDHFFYLLYREPSDEEPPSALPQILQNAKPIPLKQLPESMTPAVTLGASLPPITPVISFTPRLTGKPRTHHFESLTGTRTFLLHPHGKVELNPLKPSRSKTRTGGF